MQHTLCKMIENTGCIFFLMGNAAKTYRIINCIGLVQMAGKSSQLEWEIDLK